MRHGSDYAIKGMVWRDVVVLSGFAKATQVVIQLSVGIGAGGRRQANRFYCNESWQSTTIVSYLSLHTAD